MNVHRADLLPWEETEMRFNIVNTFAYALVFAFVYFIIAKFTDNPAVFINKEGMAVVGGGIVVAALASFPFPALIEAFRGTMSAVLRTTPIPVNEAREIVRLATIAQRGIARIEGELDMIENDFMKTGCELMLDGVTPKVFQAVMQKRVSEYQERASRNMNVLLTLSKFAPALGLAATVLGLVQLLGKLATSDMEVLGTGMAIALSGTFYGIIVANMLFQPLAELIQTKAEAEIKEREMILEGLHSILERYEPLIIGELVNSFLPDRSRIDFTAELEDMSRDAGSQATNGAAA
jgi:chemotaxis protein MotA